MPTRTAIVTGFLAATLIASLAARAFAGTSADGSAAPPAGAHHGGHDAGVGLNHMLKQLNLSPEQQTQVESIMAGAKPQLQAQHASARANREKLASSSPNDPGYPAAVAAVQNDAAAGIKLMADLKTQVYAVLTPEQQAKIPALQAAAKAQMAARRASWQAAHGAANPAVVQ